jgi:transposase, IS5 family
MNDQLNFSDMEYANRKKKTKREEFLEEMDRIIPWSEWVQLIAPYYPDGKRGRPVRGIETMLRMYLMQNWFNLSDEGIEDSIYDSYAMRCFMHIDFMVEQVPDATTLLKFRHLLEEHHIGESIFSDEKSDWNRQD